MLHEGGITPYTFNKRKHQEVHQRQETLRVRFPKLRFVNILKSYPLGAWRCAPVTWAQGLAWLQREFKA